MAKSMTAERAAEFWETWNSGDPDLVASYFTEDGIYHASVGPDRLGRSYVGKAAVREGVQDFFNRFPTGKFKNLNVEVSGEIGTFEWDFVVTKPDGSTTSTAGCDVLVFRGDLVARKNAYRKAYAE